MNNKLQSFSRKWAKIDLKTRNLVQKLDNFLLLSSDVYKSFLCIWNRIQRQIENKMKAMIKQMKKKCLLNESKRKRNSSQKVECISKPKKLCYLRKFRFKNSWKGQCFQPLIILIKSFEKIEFFQIYEYYL